MLDELTFVTLDFLSYLSINKLILFLYGPGFTEEALSNVFSLFSTGKNHMDSNMGIDLALVKMIMDAHESKIDVSNNSDGGALVKLSFSGNS